jgi:hypothetical protein
MKLLPTRVQQFPRFVQQTWQRSRVLRRPLGRVPTFHLCYFSCESYYRYLYCALHSLKNNVSILPVRVTVFSDEDMPLSAPQIAALHDLMPGLTVLPWPKSMGWGATQIESIWRAYALVAEGAHDDDIVARVDSDVFFFNDTVFQAVARSEADFVGDGHFVGFRFCQGGCYFLRGRAVRAVHALLRETPMAEMAKEVPVVVEDVMAHHLVRCAGLRTWMTWFMMFPDELRIAGGLTSWQRWKFSCVHFVMKNKDKMLDAYHGHVLGGRFPTDYRPDLAAVASVSLTVSPGSRPPD